MFYSVGRVDDKYILLCDDDGDVKEIRRFHIEGDVKTGQVYRFEQGKFLFDADETNRRKKRIKELEDELFGGGI